MPILTHDPSRFVQVRNNSDHLQVIRDPMVPGGVIRFAAGEEALISKDVYRRVFQRAATWMVNVDSETIRAGAPAVADETETESETEVPAWTHTYKGTRAAVIGEQEDRVTVAVEGGKTRSMLRTTWEAAAEPLASEAADPTQEKTNDATL
jgi:hypothetical protein